MKRIACFIFVIFIVLYCESCSTKKNIDHSGGTEKIKTDVYDILIPDSYLDYFNLVDVEFCETFKRLGSEYVSSAKVVDTGIMISVTQNQIDNLINRSNNGIKSYIATLEEYNELYHFVESADYSEFEIHCDEFFNDREIFSLIVAVSSSYAMNNILLNKDSQWDVTIKVVNCHTGKMVVEGSILSDSMIINREAWEKSYVDKK